MLLGLCLHFIYILSGLSCNTTEFECNNGNCIEKDLRCDEEFNCADRSDELNCKYTVYYNILVKFTHSGPLT